MPPPRAALGVCECVALIARLSFKLVMVQNLEERFYLASARLDLGSGAHAKARDGLDATNKMCAGPQRVSLTRD